MTIIPRNSQVIVKRIPAVGGRRPAYLQQQQSATSQSSRFKQYSQPFRPPSTFTLGSSAGSGNSNPNANNEEEESRIRAMMAASSSHWEQNQQDMPMQQSGPRRLFRPINYGQKTALSTPPDSYICYRCGQKGRRDASSSSILIYDNLRLE